MRRLDVECISGLKGNKEHVGVNVQRDERIVIDENVMTSFCPETAPDVAFQLLRWMVGDDKTKVIKYAMGY